jgi:hypothetical protein
LQIRELTRVPHSDACVELDTVRYGVQWRLIGNSITVVVADHRVRISYACNEVTCHAQSLTRRTSINVQSASWVPRSALRNNPRLTVRVPATTYRHFGGVVMTAKNWISCSRCAHG